MENVNKRGNALVGALVAILIIAAVLFGMFLANYLGDKKENNNPNTEEQTQEEKKNKEQQEDGLTLLNKLVQEGYLKETNLLDPEEQAVTKVNSNGQLVISGNNDRVATEIDGKVSKVGYVVPSGAISSIHVITEDGRLYTQEGYNYGNDRANAKFVEILLPSKIKKIYEGGAYPNLYSILLENNEVYEIIEKDGYIKLGNKLDKEIKINLLDVLFYEHGGRASSPLLKFSYNGKTYLDDSDTSRGSGKIIEIKDENGNSVKTKYAITDRHSDEEYINAYLVDFNNNIYKISKVSYKKDDGYGINTEVTKYTNKKVKLVDFDDNDNKTTITYEDGTTEVMNGYFEKIYK